MRSERGQSLVVAAAITGLAALAVVSLHASQERLLGDLAAQRVGEAAAAAAGAAVADIELAYARSVGRDLEESDVADLAGDDRVVGVARAAAERMTTAHRFEPPESVSIHAFGFELEVHLTLRGRRHVVLLSPPP